MQDSYLILMGDVIRSRNKIPSELHHSLNEVTSHLNDTFSDDILSPLTITLGDEFQGVIHSVHTAIQILFEIDLIRISQKLDYELRFVLHHGHIATPINTKTSHNMLGDGLTNARKELETMSKRARERFRILLDNSTSNSILENALTIYDGILNSWNLEKDADTILALLNNENDNEVAELLEKTRQQIWKRRNNLLIREFKASKKICTDIANWYDSQYSVDLFHY